MWVPFCYFLLHGGGLFMGLPPPPTKISADMSCYNFAIKMTKIMINCSHVPARSV